MKQARLFILSMLAGALVVLQGCQTSGGTSSAASGSDANDPANVLKIGVTADAAPMVFKQGGQLVGFEVEMGQKLGRYLNRPVKFVEVPWKDQIESLQSGKTDIIMSSMSITPERRMLVAFSNPYLSVGQMILTHRSELYRYALGIPQPLPGSVGVQEGTVGEYIIESRFARSEVKKYRDIDKAVSDLAEKRIDMVVSDAQIVWYHAALNESKGLAVVQRLLNQDYLGWPVRSQDVELLNQVNAFLQQSSQDGSLRESIRRWMPLAL